MVSINDRLYADDDRRIPASREGGLIIDRAGVTTIATLVERSSHFVITNALPWDRKADLLTDVAPRVWWRLHHPEG